MDDVTPRMDVAHDPEECDECAKLVAAGARHVAPEAGAINAARDVIEPRLVLDTAYLSGFPGGLSTIEAMQQAQGPVRREHPSLALRRAEKHIEQIARGIDDRWRAFPDDMRDVVIGRHPVYEAFEVTRFEILNNLHYGLTAARALKAQQEHEMRERAANLEKIQGVDRVFRESIDAALAEADKAERFRAEPHFILAKRAPGHV